MVICFHPGKLNVKVDSMTCHYDVYAKRGDNSFAATNPHNFCPVFTDQQLVASLQATSLSTVCASASLLMDSASLHVAILSSLNSDVYMQDQFSDLNSANSKPSPWTSDDHGFLMAY